MKWVLVLKGAARLAFEDGSEMRTIRLSQI